MYFVEIRFGDVVGVGMYVSSVIYDKVIVFKVFDCQECFICSCIRYGFQILNWMVKEGIGRVSDEMIMLDVIFVVVFQFLQCSGSIGVYYLYGIFMVFGFQFIQQVD